MLRERIAGDFMEFHFLSDSLDKGGKAASLLIQSVELRKRVEQNYRNAQAVLEKYRSRIKVDHPFL